MPQQSKTFRVFVSSTFTDMREERRLLQKNVFPKLEKFCVENGAKFQAVDLRWGVNEESQLNQKTLDICVNEIARCQKISPKPNFLILLGDKYGWQPLPTRIPENECSEILSIVTGNQKRLLETWYKLDTNVMPPEFLLQPRGEEHLSFEVWHKTEQELQTILRNAVSQLSFSPQQQIKYFCSATHQEIITGALDPEDVEEDPAIHVFALVRETDGLPDDQTANGFIDLSEGQQDNYSKQQLIRLKDNLRSKLGNLYINYPAKWNGDKTVIENPARFEEKVFESLKGIIEEQLKTVISPDEIDHEVRLHKEFRNKLTEHFCGREKILEALQAYLVQPAEHKLLAMIGDSGSGKSSVMAKATELAETQKKDATLVYRFIGTTSGSSNIISLLQSISRQIARSYGTDLTKLADQENEKSLYDMNGLSEVFRKSLGLATPDKPLFIYLDALDHLNDTDNAKALYWLPSELPENTRIVVSSLPELEAPLSQHSNISLPVLPVEDAEKILKRWFDAIHRSLTPEQQKEILNKFAHTELPIYLKLAFERAKHWHSYTSKFELKEDVLGIINNFIDLLEQEHTPDFVRDVICFMLCGRYQGLTENEILEVLVFDPKDRKAFIECTHKDFREELKDMTQIPIVFWSRLFFDLEPFLTERDADGIPIITFFHRQFNEVLRERYELHDN